MLQNDPSSEEDELKRYLRAINIGKKGLDLSHVFTMYIRPQEVDRFRLKKGDVLVSEGGDAGRTAIFDSDGDYYYQNAINRVRPNSLGKVEAEFIYHWFTYLKVIGYVEMICNVATIPHFTAEKVKAAPLAVPPLEAQQRIAQFLDEKTTQIDALIEKKRELLARFAAKRQALITRAVTKGLDPGAPMKPSGIDWIGDIPTHWSAGNIRRFAKMKTGHTPSRSHPEYWDDCTIPWFTLTDVWQLRDGTRWYLGETNEKISAIGLANSAAELLPAGTVVFSRTASVGYSGIMPHPMATTQDFWNWVCEPDLAPEYLLLLFRSMTHKFEEITNGSTHKTIYQGIAASLCVCLPPIEEQRKIVSVTLEGCARIDVLAKKVRRSVHLLSEYRTALVTAAVTGEVVDLKDPSRCLGSGQPSDDLIATARREY